MKKLATKFLLVSKSLNQEAATSFIRTTRRRNRITKSDPQTQKQENGWDYAYSGKLKPSSPLSSLAYKIIAQKGTYKNTQTYFII